MKVTVRPTNLSGLISDWLRPETILDNDFFDGDSFLPARLGVNIPSVNVKETPKEFILEVAAPGLERKDFNIEIENHTLMISAEKEDKKEETESNGYSRKEYSYNSFCRSFALPENIKESDIDANYVNGILSVHVPKDKETPVKPAHKITVT